jgi:hypothetical protein
VEVFVVRDGKRRGYAFDVLGMAQKTQIFADYLDLDKYEDAGISYCQTNQVLWNLIEGKPRAEWLDGTGRPDPDRKVSLAELKSSGSGKEPGQVKDRERGIER